MPHISPHYTTVLMRHRTSRVLQRNSTSGLKIHTHKKEMVLRVIAIDTFDELVYTGIMEIQHLE